MAGSDEESGEWEGEIFNVFSDFFERTQREQDSTDNMQEDYTDQLVDSAVIALISRKNDSLNSGSRAGEKRTPTLAVHSSVADMLYIVDHSSTSLVR